MSLRRCSCLAHIGAKETKAFDAETGRQFRAGLADDFEDVLFTHGDCLPQKKWHRNGALRNFPGSQTNYRGVR